MSRSDTDRLLDIVDRIGEAKRAEEVLLGEAVKGLSSQLRDSRNDVQDCQEKRARTADQPTQRGRLGSRGRGVEPEGATR